MLEPIDRNDFRYQAVLASEFAIPKRESSTLSATDTSYCLAADFDPSHLRLVLKTVAILTAVVVVSVLIAAAALLFCVVTKIITSHRAFYAGTAVAAVFGGLAACIFLPSFEAMLVRNFFHGHGLDFWSRGPTPIAVSIENAETYSRFKLLAEDVGVLLSQPGSGYIRLEGIGFHYMILARDVLELSLHPNGRAALISYRIGESSLRLAVVPRVRQSFDDQQKAGSNPVVFESMESAFSTRRI